MNSSERSCAGLVCVCALDTHFIDVKWTSINVGSGWLKWGSKSIRFVRVFHSPNFERNNHMRHSTRTFHWFRGTNIRIWHCMNIKCTHFHVILAHTSFMRRRRWRGSIFLPSFHWIVPNKFTRLLVPFRSSDGNGSRKRDGPMTHTRMKSRKKRRCYRAKIKMEIAETGEDVNVKLILTINSRMSESAKQIWRN